MGQREGADSNYKEGGGQLAPIHRFQFLVIGGSGRTRDHWSRLRWLAAGLFNCYCILGFVLATVFMLSRAASRCLMPGVLLLLSASAIAQTASPAIWLGGLDPISRHAKYPDMSSDYMDMFQPNAPWNHAAASVKVFELGPKFVMEASDEMLSQIFSNLKQRNISVAIGASWLPGSDACGKGVEGFTHSGTAVSVANRIHRLGGDVKYVVMDEPLYFGHKYNKQNACQWPIPEVASKVAVEIAAFQQVFPSAQICDAEPVATPDVGWVSEIMQWTHAYQSATHLSLACFQADVQWTGPWQQQLAELKNRLHAAGIQLGIIYNGDGNAQTGLQWTQQSEQRIRMVEANPALMPDQALIQSWTREPDRMLPENQTGTMTSLVLQYVQQHKANDGR